MLIYIYDEEENMRKIRISRKNKVPLHKKAINKAIYLLNNYSMAISIITKLVCIIAFLLYYIIFVIS